MYWIQTIIILLLINSAENFNLIQNKIRSRLQNPSYESKPNTSTKRVSHACFTFCNLIFNFTEPLVRPETCNGTQTDYACEMILTIDYPLQEIGFLSFPFAETLTIDNITYDSLVENAVYLEYSENSAYYILYYACLTGDYCEWEYAQQIIPQLLAMNYQSLYNLLLPKVSNSNGRPNITQCYNNTELVNCSSGSCEFSQSTDDGYNLLISRDCSIFRESTVVIGQVRYTPGPTKYDYDTIDFTCNIDECNGQFSSLTDAESLTIDGITYDSLTEHVVYLERSDNSTEHVLYYVCGTTISNSNGHPSITQCFSNTELINCSSGSCEFFQSVDDHYNLLISRDCDGIRQSSVRFANVRFIPDPAKHDYDTIDFTCNKNQCNDQANEYEIKKWQRIY